MSYFYILFMVVICFGQDYTLTGKILDAKTGNPIEFVNVYKENSTFGNTTNHRGEFDIFGLEPGTHIIIASYEGYLTQKKTVVMKEDDKAIYIEFNLVEKIITDSTVLVEARRIGKLKIKSQAEMMKSFKKPPRYLSNKRNNLPKVNRIVFEEIAVVREPTFMDWMEDNYVYVIIGVAVLVIGVTTL